MVCNIQSCFVRVGSIPEPSAILVGLEVECSLYIQKVIGTSAVCIPVICCRVICHVLFSLVTAGTDAWQISQSEASKLAQRTAQFDGSALDITGSWHTYTSNTIYTLLSHGSLHNKTTIHQLTSNRCWLDSLIIIQVPARMIIKVSGHQHRWLVCYYDLEVGHF